MKIIVLAILFSALCLRAATVTFFWDYPTNELGADLTFKIYAHTNITVPGSNWPVVLQIVGTQTTAIVTMTPGRQFFYVTASNMWGESGPSNVTNTPSVVTNVTRLKITKP